MISQDDRDHAWVLFQFLHRTKRVEKLTDDVIAHAARILADYKNLPERSGDRLAFEEAIEVAIRKQKQKIDEEV